MQNKEMGVYSRQDITTPQCPANQMITDSVCTHYKDPLVLCCMLQMHAHTVSYVWWWLSCQTSTIKQSVDLANTRLCRLF